MAVLGDLSVVINVDKLQRTDYPDDEADKSKPNIVSRYVECWSGAKFSVQVFIKKTIVFKSGSISVLVYVDGRVADSIVIEQFRVLTHHTAVFLHNFEGAIKYDGTNWHLQPFVFGEVKHVEEASMLVMNRHSRDGLGSIVVKFHHVKQRGVIAPRPDSWDRANRAVSLSEKQLKGSTITHTASYGSKTSCCSRSTLDVDWVDGADSPFAVFQFKYRSKKALQTLLLIPRTPCPTPPVPLEKRPVESLSVEEMKQLVRQYQSRLVDNEASAKLESTLAQQHIKQEKGVKQENGVKRERDPEMEDILASAYVKKPKTAETVDLSEQ